MRERIRDSLPRRSSPSPTRDRDGNESRRGVSSRSLVQTDADSREFEVRGNHRERDVDGIERECRFLAPYEPDRQRRDGVSNEDRPEEGEVERDGERRMEHSLLVRKAISGEHYPARSDSTETVQRGSRGLVRSAEELCWRRDTEPLRSTTRQCLSEEPESSRFIASRDYKCSPSHKTELLEPNSRDYNVSSRRRLKPYPESEIEQNETILVAMKSGDGRDRDTCIQESSPVSQVGSSGADFQDESSRLVSCCVRVNDSDRVDERRVDYSGNRCASQVLQTRDFDDYAGRNSSRDQQGKSFRDLGFNRGDHDSSALSRCGKEVVDESRKNYQLGSDIATREFPCVRLDVKNMGRETHLMGRKGCGSDIVEVVAADAHLEFCTKERMTDQYDSMKEHYPFVERGSSVVNERDDKAHRYRDLGYEQREVVSLDNQCQLLRNDYQCDGVDGRMYLDSNRADDKAPQSITSCLNKGRETCLANEREAVYSDNKRPELRNEYYHYDNDGRRHSNVHVEDRDGRVVQLQQVCSNKGKAAYLDKEREDVYLHWKSQQVKKDYDFGTDARIYPDINSLDTVVDREDARCLRYRVVSSDDRKEAYLQCESQRFLKDHETDSYAKMHPDVNKSYILVDREDARGLRYRRVILNDRKEAYLQCEKQQLLKDHETDSYGMMHPDVNRSDILVDREDVRAVEVRGVSFNDGIESCLDNERGDAYLRYENQQLTKVYDYGVDDRIYRDVNSSDIIVDHGDTRALERRRIYLNDGNEAYLDDESVDVYLHHKIQQQKKDYDSNFDARMYPNVNRSEIVVDQEAARALELRGVSLNDGREPYLQYENNQLLKDHEIDAYGMMYPGVSRSSAGKQDDEALPHRRYLLDNRNQLLKDHEMDAYETMHPDVSRSSAGKQDVEALRYRRYLSDDRYRDHEIGAYETPDGSRPSAGKLDEEALRYRRYLSDDCNRHHEIHAYETMHPDEEARRHRRYVSDEHNRDHEYETMHPNVSRSSAVKQDEEALRHRRCVSDQHHEIDVYETKRHDVSRSSAGRQDEEALRYMRYVSNDRNQHHEINAYAMTHRDVPRSSAGKQDDEALRRRRYPFDDRDQVYLVDERLQLRNMRYQDGRQEVHRSNDETLHEYGHRSSVADEAGEVIHENIADDYYNYSEVKRSRTSYESGRSRNHEVAYEYDYRHKLGTSREQSRYLVDERNFGGDGHRPTAPRQRARVSAKERLGGRVEDSRLDVTNQVRNPKRKGKSRNRNQKNNS